jgi:electron transfer flavoprotein beta subunit
MRERGKILHSGECGYAEVARIPGHTHQEKTVHQGSSTVKILVSVKRVPDPNQRVSVRADGSGIEDEDLTFVINPFDEVALEEAIAIRERSPEPVEVVAVGIGPSECEEQLRLALAMGADRALLVPCDEPLDPWNVAQILRQVVLRESPQLVLMGKQAIDDDANQAGQFLAALLDWPQATFASRLELHDGRVRVERETDVGIETLRVQLPAVVTVDLRLNQPRYAALAAILRARKKPLELVSLDALGVVVEPRVRVLDWQGTSGDRTCRMAGSVDELVDWLRAAKIL